MLARLALPSPRAPSTKHRRRGRIITGSTRGWQWLRNLRRALVCLTTVAIASAAAAQGQAVTDNEVIQVAERMYCPVCENIPLDDCQTVTCIEWKEEIRALLAAGRSEQQVIDSFVARFGDDVVGVPQDPVLRTLTLIVPLLATALAIGIAFRLFRRIGRRQTLGTASAPLMDARASDEAYRQRLEQDVRARR